MTSFIEPVVRQSTPSIIADKLREAIGAGELKPGERLGEAELARRLGVSRGPVREGLQRLTQEGLLVSIRHRGLFVVDLAPDSVRDVYLAREAIERAAAAKIIAGAHEEAGEALMAIVTAMAAATSPAEVGDLDIRFHESLVAHAGSPRLSRMHQTVMTETRMCIHALEATYASLEMRVGEHGAVASAIGAGDAALADELLIAHMADAVRRLIDR